MMTTIETYVRKGRGRVRKWAVDPGVRLGVKIAVYFLGGLFLSAAALANAPMPLTMGLVCAQAGWRAVVAALGGAAAGGWLLRRLSAQKLRLLFALLLLFSGLRGLWA